MPDVIAVVDSDATRRSLIGQVFARSDAELCLVSSMDQLLTLVTTTSPQAVILGTSASDGLVQIARLARALRRLAAGLQIVALVTAAQLHALRPALWTEDVTLLNGQADAADWIPRLVQALGVVPHV